MCFARVIEKWHNTIKQGRSYSVERTMSVAYSEGIVPLIRGLLEICLHTSKFMPSIDKFAHYYALSTLGNSNKFTWIYLPIVISVEFPIKTVCELADREILGQYVLC
jgi:hypothetical protein